MPYPLPSCFRSGAGGHPPYLPVAPTVTTSAYETPLGLAALSWSKTLLGLHVIAEIRLSLEDSDEDAANLRFNIRPWLLFTRRGSKRFRRHNHRIDFAWDLSRARFAASGGPEPVDGFFLTIAVNGEVILVAGDLTDLAFKKMGIKKRTLNSSLISRREHVTMKEDRIYRTQARFGEKEQTISIDLNGEMSLEVDGKQILQVRQLRWKFRGSEKVQLEAGGQIHLSWDLHNWLFPSKDAIGGNRNSTGNALFVFRFETQSAAEELQGHSGYFGNLGGHLGTNRNWSDSSGEHNGIRKKRLSKTRSSSSSSSAGSSSASSSVMEWESPEENELKGKLGFSLLISAWKS